MKYLLPILFFVACGPQDRGHELDGQFTVYHPAYEQQIKAKVFEIYGVRVDFVSFAYGDFVLLNKQCLPASHGAEVMGCIYPQEGQAYIEDIVRDRCRLILHELIHQAHYEIDGDGDYDHKDPRFDETADICKSLGIPIDNWS